MLYAFSIFSNHFLFGQSGLILVYMQDYSKRLSPKKCFHSSSNKSMCYTLTFLICCFIFETNIFILQHFIGSLSDSVLIITIVFSFPIFISYFFFYVWFNFTTSFKHLYSEYKLSYVTSYRGFLMEVTFTFR